MQMVKRLIHVGAVLRGHNKLQSEIKCHSWGSIHPFRMRWRPSPSLLSFMLPLRSLLVTGFQSYLDCKGLLRPQSYLISTTHCGAYVSLWDKSSLLLAANCCLAKWFGRGTIGGYWVIWKDRGAFDKWEETVPEDTQNQKSISAFCVFPYFIIIIKLSSIFESTPMPVKGWPSCSY